MKRFYSLLILFLVTITTAVAAGNIDSLSYAYGYQYTAFTLSVDNEVLLKEEDFKDYIRGIEEKYNELTQMNDSSYMMSYMLGGMEGVFITDGVHKKESLPRFDCIIEGLRKVSMGEISLPKDTIQAINILKRKDKPDIKIEDMDDESQCEFFTAYGIMKAYQPGLQEYIEGLTPGTKCIENRQAFASGLADIIEMAVYPPRTPYDMGKSVGLSLSLACMDGTKIDFLSFMEGTKAALGLGEPLISIESLYNLIDMDFQRKQNEYDAEYEDYLEEGMKYYDEIEIEPSVKYIVDWKITTKAISTPDELESSDSIFHANVHEAMFEFDFSSKSLNVVWKFNEADTAKWASFTEKNIGNDIALEIDGVLMTAPRINSKINGGMCSIAVASPQEINRLFMNAKKAPTKEPENIEIIEID